MAVRMENGFEIVGIRTLPREEQTRPRGHRRDKESEKSFLGAALILTTIILGCLLCDLFVSRDPGYLDLRNYSVPPGREFLFGTDTMGRDIFAMIWYGGRISLTIGIAAAMLSTILGVFFGALSGCAPVWADALMMRLVEILLSIPSLMAVILIQAILGEANVLSISFVLGITGWMSIAKVVRSEVRQIRECEYVIASKCMGGGFFHILWRHLTPNFVSSIMFMVVMNIRSAIVAESTLSFMGIGLPVEVITWGSMLSLSEDAMLANAWWIILFPGAFLVVALLCFTGLGNHLRRNFNRGQSNL